MNDLSSPRIPETLDELEALRDRTLQLSQNARRMWMLGQQQRYSSLLTEDEKAIHADLVLGLTQVESDILEEIDALLYACLRGGRLTALTADGYGPGYGPLRYYRIGGRSGRYSMSTEPWYILNALVKAIRKTHKHHRGSDL